MRELTTDEAREVQLMLATGPTGLLVSILGLIVVNVVERRLPFDPAAIQLGLPMTLTSYEMEGVREAARGMHARLFMASPEEVELARLLYTAHLSAAGIKTRVINLTEDAAES